MLLAIRSYIGAKQIPTKQTDTWIRSRRYLSLRMLERSFLWSVLKDLRNALLFLMWIKFCCFAFCVAWPEGTHWVWEMVRFLLAGTTDLPVIEKDEGMIEFKVPEELEVSSSPALVTWHFVLRLFSAYRVWVGDRFLSCLLCGCQTILKVIHSAVSRTPFCLYSKFLSCCHCL